MFDELINTAAPAAAAGTFDDAYTTFMRAVEERVLALHDDPNMSLDQANLRFSTAMNVNRLKGKHIVLLGVGGIGTWVLRVLVGMGAENVTIIDDDQVEIHNVGPQAYSLLDIGKDKVSAMAAEMLRFRGVRVLERKRRLTSYEGLTQQCGVPDILITAVDNMGIRNAIGNWLLDTTLTGLRDAENNSDTLPELFVDLRMGLGQWNAFALPLRRMHRLLYDWCMSVDGDYQDAAMPESVRRMQNVLGIYKDTALFEETEGVEEACTERAIVYTGANIASYVGALLHFINDNPLTAQESIDKFLNVDYTGRDDLPFKWLRAFNSRKWVDGKPSRAAIKQRQANELLAKDLDALQVELAQAKASIELLTEVTEYKLPHQVPVTPHLAIEAELFAWVGSCHTTNDRKLMWHDAFAAKWYPVRRIWEQPLSEDDDANSYEPGDIREYHGRVFELMNGWLVQQEDVRLLHHGRMPGQETITVLPYWALRAGDRVLVNNQKAHTDSEVYDLHGLTVKVEDVELSAADPRVLVVTPDQEIVAVPMRLVAGVRLGGELVPVVGDYYAGCVARHRAAPREDSEGHGQSPKYVKTGDNVYLLDETARADYADNRFIVRNLLTDQELSVGFAEIRKVSCSPPADLLRPGSLVEINAGDALENLHSAGAFTVDVSVVRPRTDGYRQVVAGMVLSVVEDQVMIAPTGAVWRRMLIDRPSIWEDSVRVIATGITRITRVTKPDPVKLHRILEDPLATFLPMALQRGNICLVRRLTGEEEWLRIVYPVMPGDVRNPSPGLRAFLAELPGRSLGEDAHGAIVAPRGSRAENGAEYVSIHQIKAVTPSIWPDAPPVVITQMRLHPARHVARDMSGLLPDLPGVLPSLQEVEAVLLNAANSDADDSADNSADTERSRATASTGSTIPECDADVWARAIGVSGEAETDEDEDEDEDEQAPVAAMLGGFTVHIGDTVVMRHPDTKVRRTLEVTGIEDGIPRCMHEFQEVPLNVFGRVLAVYL